LYGVDSPSVLEIKRTSAKHIAALETGSSAQQEFSSRVYHPACRDT
jgi:hypothetical protein